MMLTRPGITALAAALILVFALPGLALAQVEITDDPLTPAAVVALPNDSDGETILMQGEAIGESLRADDGHRWVNLLGDDVAVGVYMTAADAEKISSYGRHGSFGDSVRVIGVLNRWCPEHAGEFDIHATEVVIVSEGLERENPIQPWKAIVGIILAVVGFVEYQVFRHLRERRPN